MEKDQSMAHLQALEVPHPVKLSAGWAATVLCYIYCDYFDLYAPGKLQAMQDGEGPFGPVSQMSLIGAAVLLIIPSVMVFVSVVAPAKLSRFLNVGVGAIYTVIMSLLLVVAPWYFYKLFAGVEAALTATIVVMAWRWPRSAAVA